MLEAMATTFASEEDVAWSLELFPADDESKWKESDFTQVMSALKSCPDVTEVESPDYLEVVDVEGDMHGYVLKIESRPHIARYCYTESFEDVPHRWMTRFHLDSVVLPHEFSNKIRATLSRHITHSDSFDVESESWRSTLKSYAMKRDFVFEHPNRDIDIKYIVEVSRRVQRENQGFKDSDVVSQLKEYSFRVELRKKQPVAAPTAPASVETKTISKTILSHALRLMQILQNVPILLTSEDRVGILSNYNTLLEKVRFKPKYYKSEEEKAEFAKPFFLAPKPINLERIHLLEPGRFYSLVSILSGYAVTDKADGERMLLFVDEHGDAFLLNNTLDVKPTGLKAARALKNTLLDGEFISRHSTHSLSKDLFAVFDIYFLNGDSKMNLPLMKPASSGSGSESRYGFMQMALQPSMWSSQQSMLELRLKEHRDGDGDAMFKNCAAILKSKELPYEVDGLIFTPVDLPVFGYYPSNKDIKVSAKGTRWDRVFKWKPEQFNTIDFIVKELQTTTDPETNQEYRVFQLLTGYNKIQNEPIDVAKGMQLLTDSKSRDTYQKDSVYSTEPFRPVEYYQKGVENAFLPIQSNGHILDSEGRPIDIKTDTVVEFAFDRKRSDHVSKCWTPLRVREDKTRIYISTNGNVSKTANDIKVANSIWRSMHAPVTKDMITGASAIPMPTGFEQLGSEMIVSSDALYYSRDIPRNMMLSFHMLNFHNRGIKNNLYAIATSGDKDSMRARSILELACGKAGDLPRWGDNRYHTVVGVDIVKDNIENPREGSYARVIRMKMENEERNKPLFVPKNIAFVVGDCSKPLSTGEAALNIDKNSEKLLKYLFGKSKYFTKPTHTLPWDGKLPALGFDLVSCQFAIHYFFENPDKIQGFLNNVSQNLKSGGRFITTFMDGDLVHEMLAENNGIVEGKKENKTVWAIIKKYDEFTKVKTFGKVVNVFLENTNQLISEYLVKFDLLRKLAEDKGLTLLSSELFSTSFDGLEEELAKLAECAELAAKQPAANRREIYRVWDFNKKSLYESICELRKDPVQTQFSFLNRWAIFQKI